LPVAFEKQTCRQCIGKLQHRNESSEVAGLLRCESRVRFGFERKQSVLLRIR
jgi:hypothetical protein